MGALRVVPPYALAVGRDAAGVYAMELVCTHEGCDLSGAIGASAIVCPCHEAAYALGGNVLQGPARIALTHYKCTLGAAGESHRQRRPARRRRHPLRGVMSAPALLAGDVRRPAPIFNSHYRRFIPL